ncbi:MAG TPA: Ku protein [Vicinamibacterales bacterium]|jgi:DNA end-binding protein Ku|nr:Ku protein [Vicinamibacterales bacterium]
MARPLWKGSISFGLVNIPVELFVGARDHTPRFRLLHRTDLSPISLERICQTDGKAVAWDDLVKGYEVEEGQFIALTEDDFKTAAIERSRSIDIQAFVPLHDIDVRYWDTPYYALPGKGAEHAYNLFAQALQKSGRAGIAKYVMRQREHLAALLPVRGCLVVSTMRFEEDLVEVPHTARAKASAQELKLADQLISALAGEWSPEAYHDDYVPALMKVIKAKAAGKKLPAVSGKPTPPTKVVDLMARLKESLAAAQRAPRSARSPRASARRTATSTSAASHRRGHRGRRPAA